MNGNHEYISADSKVTKHETIPLSALQPFSSSIIIIIYIYYYYYLL